MRGCEEGYLGSAITPSHPGCHPVRYPEMKTTEDLSVKWLAVVRNAFAKSDGSAVVIDQSEKREVSRPSRKFEAPNRTWGSDTLAARWAASTGEP